MRKLLLLSLVPSLAFAQTRPSAPLPQLVLPQPNLTQNLLAQSKAASTGPGVPSSPPLTRAQAEAMALRSNPRITISQLLSLAQEQVVRQSRAGELPLVSGAITGEEAKNGSRYGYGTLSSTRLINHVGGGIVVSQLLTDFGHTHDLIAASKLQAEAQRSSELATRDQILFDTDQAFYNVLQAQAVFHVAQQTVTTRQTVQTQMRALTQNNLRSTLDALFDDVSVLEAQLLLLDAQSNVAEAIATLDETLGLDHAQDFTLEDDAGAPPPPPPDLDGLTQIALKQRPDLQALGKARDSQRTLSRAQEAQKRPTLSAIGTAGGVAANILFQAGTAALP